jgi:hypothetical protein
MDLRITDAQRFGDAVESGTAMQIDYSLPVDCAATPDAAIGARCAVVTSADAIAPGSVKEGWRTLWDVGQVRVLDGGADGRGSTADNSLFVTQGLFIP